ncbi:hypothetical protein J3B02_003762 [Coemansia erecta]|uniref:N-acetyltransferase domain-containing protein n=1 Tax=Coemansia asiatica TaxID=1052880 RepID=A0A9W7XL70_9FUNG|nr:hypothetical protein LPJ64_002671 [Coemansia asiatica]KAJ2849718.1 hypothetical protein J3B02_003762 [Coemansia erecta]KAJ2876469.1 hypothetical protein FB639_003898 [Coemansia asiatica]
MPKISIRPATEADADLVLWFIQEFALYGNKPNDVTATSEQLRQALAGPVPRIHALLVHIKTDDGEEKPAAFSLYFYNLSGWTGQPSLYMEDMFVCSEYRRMGIGKLLLKQVAGIAVEKGCAGMGWRARNSNTPAIDFYKNVGAKEINGFTGFSLDKKTMQDFAST